MAFSRPKSTRKAAANANKALKSHFNEVDKYKEIYRGDIPFIEVAFFNLSENLDSIGNGERGIVKIVSIPLYDKSTDDYASFTLFYNENKILKVRTLYLCADVPEYKKHLTSIKDSMSREACKDKYKDLYKFLKFRRKEKKEKKKKKVGKILQNNNNSLQIENKQHQVETKSPQIETESPQVETKSPQVETKSTQNSNAPKQQQKVERCGDKDMVKETKQRCYFIASDNFWKSLSSSFSLKPSHCVEWISNIMFDGVLGEQLKSISYKFSLDTSNGLKVYAYEKIKNKKFYQMFGKGWCMRKVNNDNYYMDNIVIVYKYNTQKLRIDWITAGGGERAKAAQNY